VSLDEEVTMLHHIDTLVAIAEDRRREAYEAARRGELAAAARRAPASSPRRPDDVVIRLCRGSDDPALERLAVLSERQLPRGSFVVAELSGELVAALPLDVPGPPLRDPFRRTTGLLDLLELRARQVRGVERKPSRSRLRRLVRA
jgi:hypothetical protein